MKFPNFQNLACYEKYLMDVKDIIFFSKLTFFLELFSQKTVCLLEQVMSVDKYPSQMEAIV